MSGGRVDFRQLQRLGKSGMRHEQISNKLSLSFGFNNLNAARRPQAASESTAGPGRTPSSAAPAVMQQRRPSAQPAGPPPDPARLRGRNGWSPRLVRASSWPTADPRGPPARPPARRGPPARVSQRGPAAGRERVADSAPQPGPLPRLVPARLLASSRPASSPRPGPPPGSKSHGAPMDCSKGVIPCGV
jgi:hypothetical protein